MNALDGLIAEGFEFLSRSIDQASAGSRLSPDPLFKFLRTRVHIRTKEKPVRLVKLKLWPTQRRHLAMKRHMLSRGAANRFLVLKYRQCGLTTIEQAISYHTVVSYANTNVTMLTDIADKTIRAFRMANTMDQHDPMAPRKVGSGNKRQLEYAHNSLFFIGTAGSDGFGRADTLQRIHGSEVSLWGKGPRKIDKQHELISGMESAVEFGDFVLETTPNGQEYFYQLWQDSKRGKNHWNRIFLPWFIDRRNTASVDRWFEISHKRSPKKNEAMAAIRDTLTDRERDLMSPHGPLGRQRLSWEQMAWRRIKVLAVGSVFQKDFPEDDETCFMTSGESRFGTSIIVQCLENIGDRYEAIKKDYRGGYRIQYKPPMKGKRYVTGVDTSEGAAGSDPNGYMTVRRDTGEIVDVAHGCWTPKELARIVFDGSNEYNKSFTAVERNNHGHAVLAHLGFMGFQDRLYYGDDGRAGWNTTKLSRDIMLDDLDLIFTDRPELFVDRQTLAEMLTFRKQTNGKWEADTGCHDDCVMKAAIAYQMLAQSDPGERYQIGRIPRG